MCRSTLPTPEGCLRCSDEICTRRFLRLRSQNAFIRPCPICGRPVSRHGTGGKTERKYCCAACRQMAVRKRRGQKERKKREWTPEMVERWDAIMKNVGQRATRIFGISIVEVR